LLSPFKIILLLLAILGVFLAHRVYRRYIEDKLGKRPKSGAFKEQSADKMLDLDQCPRCEAFVADLAEHRCQDK
jgi:hypothetical protein|tara:strand:+ start:450 stop:671 length:222 start_codon:yes stop_codon:yes gene_type:complete